MPSFKDFWEQKKHILQFVAIICGVGALFLAIPEPNNLAAKNALLNLQFIWLVFITFGVIVLFFYIYTFTYEVEVAARQKYGIGFFFQGSPSYIIMGFLVLFCLNLWKYAAALYPTPLRNFEGVLATAIVGVILLGIDSLLRKYFPKLGEGAFIIADAVLWAPFITFAISIGSTISNNQPFSLLNWVISSLFVFGFLLLLRAYSLYSRQRKVLTTEKGK